MTERTLSIIKPDAVAAGRAGAILSRLEGTGFRILAARMRRLTKEEAEGFYQVHRERPFFSGLCAFMSSGPCIALVLEGEGAIATMRKTIGATNPAEAAPGTRGTALSVRLMGNRVGQVALPVVAGSVAAFAGAGGVLAVTGLIVALSLAGVIGGGQSTPGFVGHSKYNITQRKFIKGDGGLLRMVWMPKALKEELRERLIKRGEELGMPDLVDRIADETAGITESDILTFLQEKNHPALKMESIVE